VSGRRALALRRFKEEAVLAHVVLFPPYHVLLIHKNHNKWGIWSYPMPALMFAADVPCCSFCLCCQIFCMCCVARAASCWAVTYIKSLSMCLAACTNVSFMTIQVVQQGIAWGWHHVGRLPTPLLGSWSEKWRTKGVGRGVNYWLGSFLVPQYCKSLLAVLIAVTGWLFEGASEFEALLCGLALDERAPLNTSVYLR
jgi:hypothetical protein